MLRTPKYHGRGQWVAGWIVAAIGVLLAAAVSQYFDTEWAPILIFIGGFMVLVGMIIVVAVTE